MSTLTLRIERRRAEQPKAIDRESLLQAAKDGNVQGLLTPHYRIYYDPDWIAKLQLLKDLQDEGFLRGAEFDPQMVGDKPAFLVTEPRITTSGLGQLDKLKQLKVTRRAATGLLGIVSTVGTGWLLYWLTH